jgi:hypothetical protein
MSHHFAPSPAPGIASAVPREPGTSDLSRTVEVRLAVRDYEATAPLFLSIRKTLAGEL